MSLLEDVFLQDEANEAEELERVIEGDEFDKVQRSDSDDNSEKEDEAEEDKRRADPTKAKTTRVVKHPRFLLNPARLTGPRGIQVIPEHFKDFKFKGKGYEKEDLDLVLKRLEHWAYRLYPKFQFEDCLKKIETLGKKRPVAVHLHKIRSDQFLSEDTVVQKDSSDEDTPMPAQEEDEFDKLLQQQIELARSTPAPNSAKKPDYSGSVSPKDKRTTSLMMPKATSSPSINDEQRERMLRSRRLAEERRLARLKIAPNNTPVNHDSTVTSPIGQNLINQTSIHNNVENSDNVINMEMSKIVNNDADEIALTKKHNRSNVIESSDDETEGERRVSVAIDVHTVHKVINENDGENVRSPKIINGSPNISNSRPNEEVMEINETETSENAACNSKLEENEGKSNTNNMEEEIYTENNFSDENCNRDNIQLSINNSINENEKCVSDTNLELNEHDISDKNKENIINNEEKVETAENKALSDTELTVEKTFDEESLISKVAAKSDEIDENSKVDVIQDVTNNEAAQVFDDVMDVDFSEDF